MSEVFQQCRFATVLNVKFNRYKQSNKTFFRQIICASFFNSSANVSVISLELSSAN